jgi:heat shock protein HslJ
MTESSRITDSGDDRGLCKGCRWWQAEHDGPGAEDATIGLCMQPELTHFSLQVSGHSGCNRFEMQVEGGRLQSVAATSGNE